MFFFKCKIPGVGCVGGGEGEGVGYGIHSNFFIKLSYLILSRFVILIECHFHL